MLIKFNKWTVKLLESWKRLLTPALLDSSFQAMLIRANP